MSRTSRLSPHDLLRIQLTLECKGFDENGDLVRIPGDRPDEINRFHVVRLPDRYVRMFRHDVPPDIRVALSRFSDAEVFIEQDRVRQVVAESMGPAESCIGKSYIFAEVPLPSEFPDVVRSGDTWNAEVAGRMVSWAMSARQNDSAAELGVETEPEFRRRGFARQVSASGDIVYTLRRYRSVRYDHRSCFGGRPDSYPGPGG